MSNILQRLQSRRELLLPDKSVVAAPASALDRIKSRRKAAKSRPIRGGAASELRRIIDLPLVIPMTSDEVDEYSREKLNADAYADGFRLFAPQAGGLLAWETYGCLLGNIGVGWGKTLLSLMVANHCYLDGARKQILTVPPEVFGQLAETDIAWARTKVPIQLPIHLLGGRTQAQRRSICNSGRKGLYIMPHSLWSTKDTHDNLQAIDPEVIIVDEAHKFANPSAARTRRMMEYVDDRQPKFVPLSGTITSKSIRDYYHLIRAALRDNCPLPLTAALAQQWGFIIDAGTEDFTVGAKHDYETECIGPLVDWGRKHFVDQRQRLRHNRDGFRHAYSLRLTSAPGVVTTGDAEIGTSLVIANQPVEDYQKCEGWEELKRLIDKVELAWQTPNGDEIDHAIHKWKWHYELSAGFYNQLIWPEPHVLAERRQVPEHVAFEALERAKESHELHQEYTAFLRDWLLESSRPHMDTPFLVGQEMFRNGPENVGEDLYRYWTIWRESTFDSMPERDSSAVFVCPFKVQAATKWAESLGRDTGGIIWVYHKALGEWVYDHLVKQLGTDRCVHCPAGDVGNSRILDHSNKDRICVASITAHGTGKNLQHFQHQYFLQWPRQATTAEQTLGRLHRNGQRADEIVAQRCDTLDFDFENFAACLNDALYIHQTTQVRQKLIFAGYNPRPKIFPSAVLRQRGFEVKQLNTKQELVLKEKFG